MRLPVWLIDRGNWVRVEGKEMEVDDRQTKVLWLMTCFHESFFLPVRSLFVFFFFIRPYLNLVRIWFCVLFNPANPPFATVSVSYYIPFIDYCWLVKLSIQRKWRQASIISDTTPVDFLKRSWSQFLLYVNICFSVQFNLLAVSIQFSQNRSQGLYYRHWCH